MFIKYIIRGRNTAKDNKRLIAESVIPHIASFFLSALFFIAFIPQNIEYTGR